MKKMYFILTLFIIMFFSHITYGCQLNEENLLTCNAIKYDNIGNNFVIFQKRNEIPLYYLEVCINKEYLSENDSFYRMMNIYSNGELVYSTPYSRKNIIPQRTISYQSDQELLNYRLATKDNSYVLKISYKVPFTVLDSASLQFFKNSNNFKSNNVNFEYRCRKEIIEENVVFYVNSFSTTE